ncbi:MAG: hypothetical protein NZM16_03860, partial [Thermoflexus sp.]|uniref:hypothetical protein n=1 Tax=Thermoflexus sp. TaxID=1969742 RepID=UPI0025CC8BFE
MEKIEWKGWILLIALVAIGFAARPAAASNQCDVVHSCFVLEMSLPDSTTGGGVWRCEGSVTVGAIWREDYGCAEGQIVVDCSGNILERHRFAVGSDL